MTQTHRAFERTPLGYVASYPSDAVEIRIERVRRMREDELSGEVTISCALPGIGNEDGHLHGPARLNMSGTQTRSTLAKYLAGRTNGARINWQEIIEWTCQQTLLAERTGDPVVCLRDIPEPLTPDALLPPLILGRSDTIFFGDGGAAKSYISLAAAASLHSGEPLLGITPTVTQRVLFLDWEWDGWEHRQRLKRLWPGDVLPDLLYRRCTGPLSGQVDNLRAQIAGEGVTFIVIDSVGCACDGPPEEARSALAFFDAVHSLNVGSLMTAHVNRSGDTDRPFGSTYFHNSARLTWYVKAQERGTDVLTVGLFNRKSSGGPKASPVGYEVSFTDDRTIITRRDPIDVPELAESLPARIRIAGALREGALTLVDLSEALDVPPDTVRKSLLRGEGHQFTRVTGSDGVTRWGLIYTS